MPGESLREGECLGFQVTDALPAAQKKISNQDHRPSLYWSYFNLKSDWLREEGFLVMITVHCKLNQMNAFIHITFNPALKITTKQTFKIETSQRVTKAFTNRICVSNMTFFSVGEFVGDYVNNHVKRFEFILCCMKFMFNH